MLNLTEAWKNAYLKYLDEEDKRLDDAIDQTLNELVEAQENVDRGYDILREYYTALQEASPEQGGNSPSLTQNNKPPHEEEGSEKRKQQPTGSPSGESRDRTLVYALDQNQRLMSDLLKLTIDNNNNKSNKEPDEYKPVEMYSLKKFSDMRFPENILFFISQLLKWIRNVVLYFLEKFKNLIRGLVGSQKVEVDKNALDFKLDKAEKIEQIATKINMSPKQSAQFVSGYKIDPDQVELISGLMEDYRVLPLTEDEKLSSVPSLAAQKYGVVAPKWLPDPPEKRVVVTLDLSRDINELEVLIQHFYKLFDNSYGSNNEHFFENKDLEMILSMFKNSINLLKNGQTDTIGVRGTSYEVFSIDSSKIKQNLIITNVNMENLKLAYVKVSDKIKNISRIVNSKEMLMLTQVGVDMKVLTASTYRAMKRLFDTINPRLKMAEKMESKLNATYREYQKIASELQSLQKVATNVSTIAFNSIYDRRILDLVNSSSYMSKTITVRLAGLGVYIKELKDVRDCIKMLVNLNNIK